MNSNGGIMKQALFSIAIMVGIGLAGLDALAENNSNQVYLGNTTVTNNPHYVGNNGTNNTLTIGPGGVTLTSAGAVHIGSGGSGKYNTAYVTNSGAVWMITNSGALFHLGENVGSDSNQLIISNGGVVSNAFITLSGSGGEYNNALITGTGSKWICPQFRIGNVGSYNTVTVDNGGELRAAAVYFGANGGSTKANSLVVTNGGKAVMTSCYLYGISTGGSGHSVKVTGSGSRLETPDLKLGGVGGVAASNCTFTIEQGGFASNGTVSLNQTTVPGIVARVQNTGSVWYLSSTMEISGSNTLVEVLNGATLTNSTLIYMGGYNNNLRVAGTGTVVDVGMVSLGHGSGSLADEVVVTSNATLRVRGGASPNIIVGSGLGVSAHNHRLTVSAGGQVYAQGILFLGYYADGGFYASNSVTVADAGSYLRTDGDMYLGRIKSKDNRLVVTNGAVVSCGGVAQIPNLAGTGAAGTGNVVVVTGPGSAWEVGSYMSIGGTSCESNRLEVSNGGRVRMQQIIGTASASNLATNNGGIYEFTIFSAGASPAIPNGRVYLTDGTISFYGRPDVDIKANWTGTLTNIVFAGNNAFRLNNATNAASGQAYTFATGSATNYCRLELLNGSMYRGGAVTIGSGGTLVVSNGTSTISSNLTFQPGATFAVHVSTNATSGSVVVGGTTIALGGATLQLTLGAAPVEGQYYPILSLPGTAPVAGLGTFGSASVEAVYAGRTYTLAVRYGAGDGNDVAVMLATRGTLLIMR